MDAVKYIKALRRLCESKRKCTECPLLNKEESYCIVDTGEYAEKAVQIVEQWAKDHPVKTRQSEFLKKYPDAYLSDITRLLPCSLDKTLNPLRCAKYGYLSSTCRCGKCRYDYWNEEVTDND
jgi:hypothetical protein